MINKITVHSFTSVPYLEGSALMAHHPNGIEFARDKPNVLVGPNGSGKSALLTALSLLTLSSQTGQSTFDRHYLKGLQDRYWSQSDGWRAPHEFLPGLSAVTDNGAALFYRPHHIPGNNHSITAAMMTGYFEQAKAYGKATEHKSSGQQNQAMLDRIIRVLQGHDSPCFLQNQWEYGKDVPEALSSTSDARKHQADILRQRFGGDETGRVPLLLMDEPEQSLDALAEAQLWHDIENCDKAQIIVATHSTYPFMNPERFNLIEAVPGYADLVQNACRPRERG